MAGARIAELPECEYPALIARVNEWWGRQRGNGLGRAQYASFFALASRHGCRTVTAVVSPVNAGSQRFHLAVGFTPVAPHGAARQHHTGPATGLPFWRDWDGPGEDRVRFAYPL